MKKILALLIMLSALGLTAEDPYAVMDTKGDWPDKKGNPLFYGHDKYDYKATFPDFKATQGELEKGFRVIPLDMNRNFRTPAVYSGEVDKLYQKGLKVIAPTSDYVTTGFSLYILKNCSKIDIKASDLKTTNGDVIKADRVRFFNINALGLNPRYKHAHHLLDLQLDNLKKGDLVNVITMIDVPSGTLGGMYQGKITINGLEMPLSVKVADFALPVFGSYGFFMKGVFYLEGPESIMQRGFVEENLKRYFDFYRTRRQTTVELFDPRPNLKYVDGKVICDFSEVTKIHDAMRSANLNGIFLVDLRTTTYWCNAVAMKIKELGYVPEGDLGVYYKDRKSQKVPYSEESKQIFEQALYAILDYAERHNWINYRLLVEEEVGNRYDYKVAGYESFAPILMKVCPEKAALVDNGIGYGRKNAIDYGKRDKIPFRQYNSWEEEALVDAHENGAEVSSMNYGFNRLTYGFIQQRIGGTGHCQWADLWDSYNFQWHYLKLTPSGVVSCLEMERAHEGCIDAAACAYLRTLIERAKAKGVDAEAIESAEEALKLVSSDLPVAGEEVRMITYSFSEDTLNARRWQIFTEIEKLLKIERNNSIVKGEPKISIVKSTDTVKDQNYIINVAFSEGTIEPNGKKTEKFWSRTIGPFSLLLSEEAKIKARASSLEEFKALNQPSHTTVNFACLKDGLAIFSENNNVVPMGRFRYEREDDDGDMWRDDCMEFLFDLPNGKTFHFMYNSAGKKVFLEGGTMIPSKDIQSYIKYPRYIRSDGSPRGTDNKLLIPWKYFGLSEAPAPGTVWKLNVGREFHTNQQIMSWARVSNHFNEREKWGSLVFGEGVTKVKIPTSITVGKTIDRQVISGNKIKFPIEGRADKSVKEINLIATLINENGDSMTFSDLKITPGLSDVFVGTKGLKSGKYTLQFRVKGTQQLEHNKIDFTVLDYPWMADKKQNQGKVILDLDSAKSFAKNSNVKFNEDNSITVTANKRIFSKTFKVNPKKQYRISAEIKAVDGKEVVGCYLGFKPLTADGKVITVANLVTSTDMNATLAADVKKGDKVIKLKNADNWKLPSNWYYIAFNAKEDFSDAPNFEIAALVKDSIKKNGDCFEVTLQNAASKDYPAGTVVRRHVDGTSYMYTAALDKKATNSWQQIEAVVSGIALTGSADGKKWWAGTENAEILIMAASSPADGEYLIKDIILTEF